MEVKSFIFSFLHCAYGKTHFFSGEDYSLKKSYCFCPLEISSFPNYLHPYKEHTEKHSSEWTQLPHDSDGPISAPFANFVSL